MCFNYILLTVTVSTVRVLLEIACVEIISPVRVYDLSLAVMFMLCLSSAEFEPAVTCSALNSF